MKHFLSLLVFTLCTVLVQAQSWFPYSFSKSNQPYTYLSGATSLTNNSGSWDDTTVIAPIGFSFKFLEATNVSDTVLCSTWGFLAFRNAYYPTPLIRMGRSMIPFAGDLREKSLTVGGPVASDISCQTTGTAGSRIFKSPCKYIGFFDDTIGTDSLNFQIWLYEGSNLIEYHYGPSKFTANSWYWQDGGCRIGIYNNVSIDTEAVTYAVNECTKIVGNSYTANDTTMNSTFDFFDPSPDRVLTGGPVNGQVFTFEPQTNTSVNDINTIFEGVNVYYNPSIQTIQLHQQGQVNYVSVIDDQGKMLLQISQPTIRSCYTCLSITKCCLCG